MKYPNFTVKQFDQILKHNNYTVDRHNGDHCIYKNINGTGTVVIPVGHKDLNRMVTRRIIKENRLIIPSWI